MGKYKLDGEYESHLGKLKVVSFKHFDDINDHPFIDELTVKQKDEIKEYIEEAGFDLIGLKKI